MADRFGVGCILFDVNDAKWMGHQDSNHCIGIGDGMSATAFAG